MSNRVIVDQLFPGSYFALASELPEAIAQRPDGAQARHVILYRKLHQGDTRIVVPAGHTLVSQGYAVVALPDDTEVIVMDL